MIHVYKDPNYFCSAFAAANTGSVHVLALCMLYYGSYDRNVLSEFSNIFRPDPYYVLNAATPFRIFKCFETLQRSIMLFLLLIILFQKQHHITYISIIHFTIHKFKVVIL